MQDSSERIANLSLEKRRLLELLLLEKAGGAPNAQTLLRRRESAQAPLSFSQQRLWFFDHVTPGNSLHNLSSALRLTGRLDRAALERALSEIVRRHESLRTTFPVVEGRPVQSVAEAQPVSLTFTDLTELPAHEREARALRSAKEESRQPFDLARGPLLRAHLLRLDETEHVLVFTMHHIISDGWSQGVLVREVSELYRASLNGGHARLPELPVQYADYACWQREALQGEALESQLAYWRPTLDGIVALDLPTDRPRAALRGFDSAVETFELTDALTDALRTFSRREGVTLFMALLTGFDVLLHRYSGQADISIGSSVANRTRREIENIIGCFVNLLVLRTNLSGNPTLRELLARVRETCLGAYAHADLPFERVVSELQPERNLNRNPLFNVLLVLMNAPANDLELPGLTWSEIELEPPGAENDLSLMLFEEGKRLTGRLTYNTDLFDASTIRRMLDHWRRALECLVANPEQRLSQVQLLSEAELHQILDEWNETATGYERDSCVHELFEAQASETPDAVALVFEEGELTYGELNARANQLAHYLRAQGVGPEVRVGVCMERSAEMIVALLGILKAGGVYVPLDPSYPLERLSFMLEDVMAPVLLTREALLDALPVTAASAICLDSEWDFIARESTENPESGAACDNLCYVMYTSGSTGEPKGVSITHRGVVRLVRKTNYVELGASEIVLQFAPISFDASTLEIWGSLLNGARLVLPPASAKSAEDVAEAIKRHGITTLWLTAAFFQQMVEHFPASLRPVRQLLAGGDVLPLAQVQKALRETGERRLINGYGPTENTTFTCCHVMEAGSNVEWTVPIGRPIANTQVYILDRNMSPVPVGAVGELYVGGDGLARDYLNRPHLTAEKFVPHPFSRRGGERLYKTGDLVRYLADGRIEFLGRADTQVKVRGFRIELGEIETILSQHHSVGQCVVVARADASDHKRLVAYVVGRDGQSPAPEELRDFLKQQLPDYMLPSLFVALEALPLTPNGKVDRRALPAPETMRAKLTQSFVPPRTPAEKLLAEVWAHALGTERVGVHDNFFELGGDSIRSIEVCARAQKAGLNVSVQQLFNHQTIGELARIVEPQAALLPAATAPFALVSERDRARLPADVEDAYPLTRLQAGMLFHSAYTAESAVYHDIFSFHLRAPFDLAAWQTIIRELLERHAALRTSFDLAGYDEPLQLVHATAEAPLMVEDLRHLSASEQERFIAQHIETERTRPFDWKRAPLLRLQIHRRSEESFQLTLNFHHAIIDGWSLASLLTDIFNRYAASLKGASSLESVAAPAPSSLDASDSLPEVTFRDYVSMELEALASEECREFWQRKLDRAAFVKLPRWPHSLRKEKARRQRGLLLTLAPELCEGLRGLAQAEGVPLKSVLLAAHLRVLSFVGAQADVTTGLVSNGRPEAAGGERLVGLFLNTLPLRLQLPGGTWRELVRATFEAESEALPFRRFPLAEMQNAYAGGQPLFETCFNFTHFHVFQGISETEEVQLLDSRSIAETNFTLMTNFNLEAGSSDIQLVLDYNSAELSYEQIEAFGRYYLSALDAMARQPHARYETHSLLPTDERRRLLVEWNETQAAYPRAQLLHETFEAQAARTPDAPAVLFKEGRVSYGELNRQANRLAHHLRSLGVGPETTVGILLERTPEMIISILGTLKAGGAYLPLDPAYPHERLALMLEDSRAAVLLTQPQLSRLISSHTAHTVYLDEARGVLAEQREDNPSASATSDNLAYVIYTSGSTGRPKGVGIQHRNAVAFLSWARSVFSPERLAGVFFSTSICFDLSIFELFATLDAGGQVILGENALQLPSSPHADEVTLLNLVPSALAELLRQDALPSSVRTINLAGERLGRELVAEAYRREHVERVYNLYGPSEDTTYSTFTLVGRPSEEVVTIGRPIANTQVYLLDSYLQPVPVGTPGLIYLGGEGLARGYVNEPRMTARRFIPHPFADVSGARLYDTGDVARYLPDGNIEFLGRNDHQVKIRGFRIELGEIEETLKRSGMVESACVLALEHPSGEKRLVAYVVWRDPQRGSVSDLRAFLSEKLPGYMMPSAFVSLDELPLTPNGKLNRAALPAPETESFETTDAASLPRDTLELTLMHIWQELLGVEQVGVRDNFFLNLGGNSILAVRLIAQIEKHFGRRLSLATLMHGPTIEQLAVALRREGHRPAPTPLVPVNPHGTSLPFFCVHPAMGNALCYVQLARHLGTEQPFYGLQSPGLDGTQRPLESIEDLAAHYVEALRTVQPSGPYLLGGHSFGGIVAFEMAQQLQRAGHEVALLALMDTFLPSPPVAPASAEPDDTLWLCEIARVFERFLNREFAIEYEELKRLDFEEQLAFVLAHLKGAGMLPQDAGVEHIRGLLDVEKASVKALRRYVAEPYGGRITLLRAALSDEDGANVATGEALDPAEGWQALCDEPLDVLAVPGDHITMITEPNVAALARQLRARLERLGNLRRS